MHISPYKKTCDIPEEAKDIIISNVNSMSNGINMWRSSKPFNTMSQLQTPSVGDGIFEIYTGYGTSAFSTAMLSLPTFTRINQSDNITMYLKKPTTIQLDGEAWDVKPGKIIFNHFTTLR
eukprot:UN27258